MRAWGAHDTHALSSTPKVCSTPRCAHALPPPLPLPQASTTEGPPTTIPLGQAATAHGTSELQRAATARRPLATGNSGDGTRNGQGLPGMGAVALVLQGRCPLGSMCTSGLLHTPLCCFPPPLALLLAPDPLHPTPSRPSFALPFHALWLSVLLTWVCWGRLPEAARPPFTLPSTGRQTRHLSGISPLPWRLRTPIFIPHSPLPDSWPEVGALHCAHAQRGG